MDVRVGRRTSAKYPRSVDGFLCFRGTETACQSARWPLALELATMVVFSQLHIPLDGTASQEIKKDREGDAFSTRTRNLVPEGLGRTYIRAS